MTQTDPLHLSAVKNANFLKFNMADGRPMLKTEKLRYLCDALTNHHKIRQGDAKALNRPCAAAMRPFIK